MAFIFYFLFLFFILLLLGEEMWKFNCWRVSLQLSNFIYLVFFFRLVSEGRQAFGQYFYRHHFFSSSLNMPLISLVSEGERRRRRRRRRERERERGDLLRVTGSSNSSGNSHNRKERKKRLAALLFAFLTLSSSVFFHWRFSSTSLDELAVVLFFWLIIRNNHHNGHIPGPASAARFPRQIFLQSERVLSLCFSFGSRSSAVQQVEEEEEEEWKNEKKKKKEKKGAGYVVCYCVYARVWKRPVCYTR